ncbi:hypothetical protein AS96_00140 [Microbacterium sp. MRS-1]|nr:hypothetical protein AS96_00140 [Microbacterium sp. MRS-1]
MLHRAPAVIHDKTNDPSTRASIQPTMPAPIA